MKFNILVATFLLVGCIVPALAQEVQETEDQAMIRGTIEAYVDAFNHRDAKMLASNWTEDCSYIDMTGRMVTGRETIQSEYEDYFRIHPEASMQITVLSMSFASDDVAIEDGVRVIIENPGSDPKNIRYTAIHVHDGDKWLVKSVRDAVAFEPTNYQYLRVLEWLVGEWTEEEHDGVIMQSACNWT